MRAYLASNPYSRRAMALKYGGGIGRLGQDGTLDPGGFLDAPTGTLTSNDPGIDVITSTPIDLPVTGSPLPTTLGPSGMCPDGSPPFSDGSCAETGSIPTGTQITDSSGVVWTCDSTGSCCPVGNPVGCQLGPPATNDPTQAAIAAKVAAISQATGSAYGAASAATIAANAATAAAQVANAVARSIAPTSGTLCPSGYVYGAPGQSVQLAPGMATVGTGKCIPITGLGITPAGQWFSFATNAQIMTFGLVIVGALIIVPMLSGGGGGRRRR